MRINDTSTTVVEYCNAMDRGEIKINRDYQRNSKVWPVAARSFLVETILLDYPIPKFFLYQSTNIKTRQTIKEIVDGQQRSSTIYDFFHGNFRVSRTSEVIEARGKLYEELDEELQQKFLEYTLSIDLFISASTAQIREAFRRMNSYNVPLNAEEHRHAVYQGEFKWVVYQIARDYSTSLRDIGVFTDSQLIRMQDVKLFCEVIHSMIFGIKTTKKADLDKLYKAYDEEGSIPDKNAKLEVIDYAVNYCLELEDIHKSSLMKPHVFYSLLLAVAHCRFDLPELEEIFNLDGKQRRDQFDMLSRLTQLSEAVSGDEETSVYPEMVRACSGGTNVKDKREARVRLFCEAIMV
ncbi:MULTISPECIES: DUF262 domain-containing protein [Halomonadaceae]|uniref:DUF262 domain-containing protein n=1 Tax=Halomonadaceae TaxID=28256 RepID=UPI001582A4FD|nr:MULTISPECIES: DUF262 domain-containing protein [Halomonas]MDI4636719.1 DUF262 domain-containing protein [Halomonas sp. BMC7]NUJ61084.1 DUF262 domain-containing protein [Halomonas taeanensis]